MINDSDNNTFVVVVTIEAISLLVSELCALVLDTR